PRIDLRGASQGAVPHRSGRPAEASAARARRSDRRGADAGAPPAAADEAHHRRSVEREQRAGGAGPPLPRPPGKGEIVTAKRAARTARRRKSDAPHVLRLYVTGVTGKSVRAIQNVRRICEEH